MTEGTYPYHFGGVSVWCDQLVRGMADHRFHVTALVGMDDGRPEWELPDNIASVTVLPLWDSAAANHRPARRRAQRRFRPLLDELITVLLGEPDLVGQRFADVLRALFDYGRDEHLGATLCSEDAVCALSGAWRNRWPVTPSVHDAITALRLLEHSLRPLAPAPVRADVSHCAANGLAVLPAFAAKWTFGTPLLLTEHGIYLRERYLGHRSGPFRWPVKALHLAFLRQVCAMAYREAAVITPGNVYNRRWEQRLGAAPTVIRTVYNGVDPADFPAVESEPEVPTISWAGRMDPIKDLETLLRAFVLVRDKLPDARLRLFGDVNAGGGHYANRCVKLAGELGVAAAVRFEGRVPEIRDAYAAGNVVVLSSISEGFPYTVIEAMTCGRACVATDVGGVSEAVADTGFVVPPRDPETMAAACVRLLTDTELRSALGAAARMRALELFTVDRAIGTFDEIYAGLALTGHAQVNQ